MTITVASPDVASLSNYETLLDYKRSVSKIYAEVRRADLSVAEKSAHFRAGRDALFKTHPQSALPPEKKPDFTGLRYYDYDPAWRFILPLDTEVEPEVFEIQLQHDGLTRLQRMGQIHFSVARQLVTLSLYWLLGYGGGVFLPFRDLTNGVTTYGGGRYLLDTIKHADLGHAGDQLVIDFNFAYNPSCAYNPRWVCPLAPTENRVSVAIEAGEMAFE